jgi:hypothetical protein
MKTIAIYSPITGHGHLDSWFLEFIKIFLDENWVVIAINPNCQQVASKLLKFNQENLNNLCILNSKLTGTKEKIQEKKWVNIWRKINSVGLTKLMSPKNTAQKIHRCTRSDYLIYLYLPLHLFRFYFVHLFKKLSFTKIIKNCDLTNNLLEIEQLIGSNGLNPSLVFHMYLDVFDIKGNFLMDPTSKKIRYKWAGLRFFPAKEDSQLQALFTGIAYLNALKNNHLTLGRAYKTIFLPDVANTIENKILRDHHVIRNRAGNRKIVLLAGIIDVRKNITLWSDLIKQANPNEWYFLQIGEIDFKQLSIVECFKMYNLLIRTPENLTIIPHFLDDEGGFNNYFKISDIIFAVYKEFKYSSGILSKASAFYKPILVSDKYQMGKFVDEYQIGYSVNEDDVGMVMRVLDKMAKRNFPVSNFESYNDLNSKKILKDKLINFCLDAIKIN